MVSDGYFPHSPDYSGEYPDGTPRFPMSHYSFRSLSISFPGSSPHGMISTAHGPRVEEMRVAESEAHSGGSQFSSPHSLRSFSLLLPIPRKLSGIVPNNFFYFFIFFIAKHH
jgi:hypothetical protein